jgi:hypothetical protein
MIWAINTEILAIWFGSKLRLFKANKYFFSLMKIIFKMLANNFKHQSRIKVMGEIINELKPYREDLITVDNMSYELCKQYLKHREEIFI